MSFSRVGRGGGPDMVNSDRNSDVAVYTRSASYQMQKISYPAGVNVEGPYAPRPRDALQNFNSRPPVFATLGPPCAQRPLYPR
jgi:hypothetical protein